jgi:hypothetical protein
VIGRRAPGPLISAQTAGATLECVCLRTWRAANLADKQLGNAISWSTNGVGKSQHGFQSSAATADQAPQGPSSSNILARK